MKKYYLSAAMLFALTPAWASAGGVVAEPGSPALVAPDHIYHRSEGGGSNKEVRRLAARMAFTRGELTRMPSDTPETPSAPLASPMPLSEEHATGEVVSGVDVFRAAEGGGGSPEIRRAAAQLALSSGAIERIPSELAEDAVALVQPADGGESLPRAEDGAVEAAGAPFAEGEGVLPDAVGAEMAMVVDESASEAAVSPAGEGEAVVASPAEFGAAPVPASEEVEIAAESAEVIPDAGVSLADPVVQPVVTEVAAEVVAVPEATDTAVVGDSASADSGEGASEDIPEVLVSDAAEAVVPAPVVASVAPEPAAENPASERREAEHLRAQLEELEARLTTMEANNPLHSA